MYVTKGVSKSTWLYIGMHAKLNTRNLFCWARYCQSLHIRVSVRMCAINQSSVQLQGIHKSIDASESVFKNLRENNPPHTTPTHRRTHTPADITYNHVWGYFLWRPDKVSLRIWSMLVLLHETVAHCLGNKWLCGIISYTIKPMMISTLIIAKKKHPTLLQPTPHPQQCCDCCRCCWWCCCWKQWQWLWWCCWWCCSCIVLTLLCCRNLAVINHHGTQIKTKSLAWWLINDLMECASFLQRFSDTFASCSNTTEQHQQGKSWQKWSIKAN